MNADILYKIGVNIPEEFLQKMMDSVNKSIEPVYPGYDRTFSYWKVTGTWRPLPGSDPFLGNIGEIEIAEEMRVEFAVREKDLRPAIEAVRRIHPYEEPAIDVIPMIGWKSVITADPSDGT